MSSSSSLHRNSPRIVPVLFLIAMDEQTVSLILPYQPARGLPQNSPELSQPTASSGAASFVHIWKEEALLPGDECMRLRARSSAGVRYLRILSWVSKNEERYIVMEDEVMALKHILLLSLLLLLCPLTSV